MRKTTMTPTRPGLRRAGVLAVLLALTALFALAPAVEAATYGYYRTSYGSFPVVYRGWGYWLARDWTPAPAPVPAPGSYQPTQAERLAVDLINADRAKNGLPALTLNSDLAKVAHVKAEDMALNGYFDHNSPTYGSPFDMMRQFGISYRAAGENIARASSVERAEELFLNSSGHRANILSTTYTQVGVGVYVHDGLTYVSQMFITP
ncbi:MAG: CAP domain-containing protein [Bacillota bacterium]|nr:CAP domain-containing protein [Bacillota bacterium]